LKRFADHPEYTLRKLTKSGIPKAQITVVQAKTASANAADAVLTVLFGRHAEAGFLNIVLSDDKQWFGELPFMEISPGIRTVWMRFSELDQLDIRKFPLSREEEQLCKLFVEYCRGRNYMYQQAWPKCSHQSLESEIQKVYNGKKFRGYVESMEASWKKDHVGKAVAQVQADFNAKSNGSPPPPPP